MEILIREGEPFDSALKRFKQLLLRDGIHKEVSNRKQFAKPSERRKFKKQRALMRFKKRQRARNSFGG
jgi:small subunit ribosomal protein S21